MKKLALVIGNNLHDDPDWNDLKTPEQDAASVAAVLEDGAIGGFDEVVKLVDATVAEMRIAIAQLFHRSTHKPDDLLVFYFSGHGALDENDNLYFVGRDTRRDKTMIAATGLNATYVTDAMNNARSRRQLILLDSCYSGSFAKGNDVPTVETFHTSGYGRYILTASEALQRSWEGDTIDKRIEHSFFTHHMVEGIRSGAADRDHDGWIGVDELYDYIRDAMRAQSLKQTPLKKAPHADGELLIVRSPIDPTDRQRDQFAALLEQADAAAERGDYKTADGLLSRVIDTDGDGIYGKTAQEMRVEFQSDQARILAYGDVKRLMLRSKRAARTAWRTFTKDYPDYDPDGIAAQLNPAPIRMPAKTPLLPPPFEWIEIPGGSGTMQTHKNVTLSIPTERYSMGKYPVTNAQFAKFIEAGGYKTKQWWTDAGWKQREKDSWTEPRYWNDKRWNGAEQPVVGVSWYEAVAFCLWLSDASGEKIMLPTEDQWQYAAQGDDGREYPWGNEWDKSRFTNNVRNPVFLIGALFINSTTSVTQYEGKGDSPFGLVDMAGNVWEWCLTDYDAKTNDVNSNTTRRVVRGGSWYGYGPDVFRCGCRVSWDPHYRNGGVGFRLSRS